MPIADKRKCICVQFVCALLIPTDDTNPSSIVVVGWTPTLFTYLPDVFRVIFLRGGVKKASHLWSCDIPVMRTKIFMSFKGLLFSLSDTLQSKTSPTVLASGIYHLLCALKGHFD